MKAVQVITDTWGCPHQCFCVNMFCITRLLVDYSKGVVRNKEPTENYHSTLQVPAALLQSV